MYHVTQCILITWVKMVLRKEEVTSGWTELQDKHERIVKKLT